MDRGFGLNGLFGLFIAVAILLTALFFGGKMAIEAQASVSTKGYSLDTSKIKMFNDNKTRQDFMKKG